jgi:transcriptional regulator with XRE-family HTH domain
MIGKELKAKRVEKEITISKLHKLTGIGLIELSRYEIELKPPTIEHLKLICDCLNLDYTHYLEILKNEDASVYAKNKQEWERFNLVCDIIGKAKPKIKPDEITRKPCICGGTLLIRKSACNGHVCAICNNCGFKMIE